MELLITIAYIFLVRLVFFEYKWIRFNLFWKFVVFGLYAAAALTEVILLCQYAPFSKEVYVTSRVIPVASYLGGTVNKIYIEPNTPIQKGDPLFSIDDGRVRDKIREIDAQLAIARQEYQEYRQLLRKQMIAGQKVEIKKELIRQLEAQRAVQEFDLAKTITRAPTDGYVVNLQLRTGTNIRIKNPVLSFISSDEIFIIGKFNQQGSQFIRPGDKAEVAFKMYPGQVFNAQVDNIIWADGSSQSPMGARIPHLEELQGGKSYAVKLNIETPDPKTYPLRFGASGFAAIYTGHGPDFLKALRQIEMCSESLLNYIYNPF